MTWVPEKLGFKLRFSRDKDVGVTIYLLLVSLQDYGYGTLSSLSSIV